MHRAGRLRSDISRFYFSAVAGAMIGLLSSRRQSLQSFPSSLDHLCLVMERMYSRLVCLANYYIFENFCANVLAFWVDLGSTNGEHSILIEN